MQMTIKYKMTMAEDICPLTARDFLRKICTVSYFEPTIKLIMTNSPKRVEKLNKQAEKTPDQIFGKIILVNALKGLAPKISADSIKVEAPIARRLFNVP